MNSNIIIVAVFCALSVVYGFPAVDEKHGELIKRAIPNFSVEELADVSAPSIRHKRATCDLLSGFGVNHSACAAHCILLGRKGGYCNDQAVCICRK